MADYIDLKGIADRIREIQEKLRLNASAFCDATGLSTSSYSQMIGGKQKVNIDTINKVIARWGGDYDPQWILFGAERIQSEGTPHLFSSENQSEISTELATILMRQAEEIGRLKEALAMARPKEIERIMVFYTDKSVANYVLE